MLIVGFGIHRCIERARKMFLAVLVVGAMLLYALHAQAAGPDAAVSSDARSFTLPVRNVNGHLYVLAHVIGVGLTIPVALEVSLEEQAVLVIQYEALRGIIEKDIEKARSGALNIDFVFNPDMEVTLPLREIRLEQVRERGWYESDIAARYSKLVDDYSIKGRLGRGFFAKYRTVFDVASGVINFYPLDQKELEANVVLPFEVRKGRAVVAVEYGNGKSGSMILGSEHVDTFVDSTQAAASGHPSGEIPEVWLGAENDSARLNLARYLPFRPCDFNNPEYGYNAMRPIAYFVPRPQSFTPEEYGSKVGTTFVTGVTFLEKFIIEFDFARGKVGITPAAKAKFSEDDYLFYKARQSGNADQMLTYLESYPQGRFTVEAAWWHMKWRLIDNNSTDDQFMNALQQILRTSPSDRKMEDAESFVMLIGRLPGRDDLTIRASALVESYSREAIINHVVHRLHNYAATAYLNKGGESDLRMAWKFLLSASFVSLPVNGPVDEQYDPVRVNVWHNLEVQLHMGMLYEAQGRLARAYSRYRAAADLAERQNWINRAIAMEEDKIPSLSPDLKRGYLTSLQIIDALNRVDEKLSPEDREILAGH